MLDAGDTARSVVSSTKHNSARKSRIIPQPFQQNTPIAHGMSNSWHALHAQSAVGVERVAQFNARRPIRFAQEVAVARGANLALEQVGRQRVDEVSHSRRVTRILRSRWRFLTASAVVPFLRAPAEFPCQPSHQLIATGDRHPTKREQTRYLAQRTHAQHD